ncbi:hypothetical protein K456DRAFT_44125 [Colletotrichum gloeosporioides 23]|nr:hypothetical protein K456DRAFT_44125 [Colletotrichum gloeosporioides 23]
MKPNRNTQIAIFPTPFGHQNAVVLTIHNVGPAAVAAMNKDDVHHAPHNKSNEERVSVADSAKDLLFLQNDDTPDRPSDVEKGLPWKDYRAEYKLHDLGGILTVAVRHRKLFHISELARLELQEVLAKLRRLRHPNVLEFIHAYKTRTSLHAVFESTAINFLHLVKCPVYLDEAQLGAVVGQISNGFRPLKTKTDICADIPEFKG